jgi:4-hydroxy-2-oxoheptanedioate aldolase
VAASGDPTPEPLNRLKALWAADRPALGILLTAPSVQVTQLLARAGFDWLLVDLEHGPIDLATAHAMIAATQGTPAVPIARVAATVPWLAKPLLDAGALGIVFPMVNGRAEAEAAVRAVKYPPAGDRLWGPFYAPPRWDLPMPRYMRAANDGVLTMVMIEHPEAVQHVEEIVAVPGVDLAVIGIFDLATALGVPLQLDHPNVAAGVERAEAAILASGVALGGVARSPEQANRMIERGYRFLALGFDWSLLQRGAAAVLEGVRRG